MPGRAVVVGGVMMVMGSGMFGKDSGRVFVAGLFTFSIDGVLATPLMFARVGERCD